MVKTNISMIKIYLNTHKINPILSGTDSSGSDIQGCIVSLTPWLNHHKIYKLDDRDLRIYEDFTKRSKCLSRQLQSPIPSYGYRAIILYTNNQNGRDGEFRNLNLLSPKQAVYF